jgi:CHASE2 domain-containing sensor protein
MAKKRKRKLTSRNGTGSRRGSDISFVKRGLRATPVIVLLILLVVVFSRLGVLHKFETVALDSEMRVNVAPAQSDVAIVNIIDEDYQRIFESQSPLNPGKLHDLIDDIASGGPKVVGADIDTSDKQFQVTPRIETSWPPIIWEREVKHLPESVNERLEPKSVLGERGPVFDQESGLAHLIADSDDKVIRRYPRFLETSEGLLPSFAWAVVHKFDPEKTKTLDENTDPLLIRYSGDREGSHRFEFTATKVHELSQQWRDNPGSSPIRGKIVLLGGSYLDKDQYDTPLGRMIGVRILGSVIETELAGGGFKAPNKFTIALLEIFDGLLLILLFHIVRPLKALLISAVIIPILSLACSLISFGSVSRWAYFAPVLIGVLLYELYEDFRRRTIPHLYEEISHTTRRPEQHRR